MVICSDALVDVELDQCREGVFASFAGDLFEFFEIFKRGVVMLVKVLKPLQLCSPGGLNAGSDEVHRSDCDADCEYHWHCCGVVVALLIRT